MKTSKEKFIQDQVEKTMGLLDSVETVDGNPFLFTRIKSQLESPENKRGSKLFFPMVYPQKALLITVLVLNIISLALFFTTNEPIELSDEPFMSSLTDEYYLSVDNDILNNLEEKE